MVNRTEKFDGTEKKLNRTERLNGIENFKSMFSNLMDYYKI